MKAIMLGAQAIETGYKQVVAAGGMESMSNAPYLLPRTLPTFGKFETIDSLQNDGLWDVYNHCAMGVCAENTASKHSVSRESQDEHCIGSYKRAAAAWKSGAFDQEIAPVTVRGKKKETLS